MECCNLNKDSLGNKVNVGDLVQLTDFTLVNVISINEDKFTFKNEGNELTHTLKDVLLRKSGEKFMFFYISSVNEGPHIFQMSNARSLNSAKSLASRLGGIRSAVAFSEHRSNNHLPIAEIDLAGSKKWVNITLNRSLACVESCPR